MLRSALDDPLTFAREADRPLCIDEVQRGGDALVRAIKVVVDERWDPGQFVLSGSTRFLRVPTLSESLAGRAGFIELWPLSAAERAQVDANIVDDVFLDAVLGPGWCVAVDTPRTARCRRRRRLPGAVAPAAFRSEGWYDSYVRTIAQRDIRELSRVQHAGLLPALLRLVAARSGSTLVHRDLAAALGNLSPDTVRNYLAHLEMVFLIGYARPWSTNLTAKIAKTPKAYITDSGLAANLLGVTVDALYRPGHPALGPLVETFVFDELTTAASIAGTPAVIHHLRDRDGREIDFVLEERDGRLVAIEVKASAPHRAMLPATCIPWAALRLPTSRRARALSWIVGCLVMLGLIAVAGTVLAPAADATDLLARRRPPSLRHPFGTDWLGRDMLARTVVGLRLSLAIGIAAAAVSAVIALTLGALAGALGSRVDATVGWLVDPFLALPHLVLLILVAFAAGRGVRGVVIAVALTHWPSLTRVLRGEARRVAASDYVAVAAALGRSDWWIARRHLVPHSLVGTVLLVPHAILHEAALSFLGLGLSPHAPAVGVILSDAMRYLSSGAWWLALLPGVALLVVVKAVDVIGEHVRALVDPRSVHE